MDGIVPIVYSVIDVDHLEDFYTFVLIKHWYMKRLAIIITGMLASLLVASAQSYVRAGWASWKRMAQ